MVGDNHILRANYYGWILKMYMFAGNMVKMTNNLPEFNHIMVKISHHFSN